MVAIPHRLCFTGGQHGYRTAGPTGAQHACLRAPFWQQGGRCSSAPENNHPKTGQCHSQHPQHLSQAGDAIRIPLGQQPSGPTAKGWAGCSPSSGCCVRLHSSGRAVRVGHPAPHVPLLHREPRQAAWRAVVAAAALLLDIQQQQLLADLQWGTQVAAQRSAARRGVGCVEACLRRSCAEKGAAGRSGDLQLQPLAGRSLRDWCTAGQASSPILPQQSPAWPHPMAPQPWPHPHPAPHTARTCPASRLATWMSCQLGWARPQDGAAPGRGSSSTA